LDPRHWGLCPQIPREGREEGKGQGEGKGRGGNGERGGRERRGKFASLPLGDRRPCECDIAIGLLSGAYM